MTEIAVASLARFRPWLYGAAVYNLVWGGFVVLFPGALFQWLGLSEPLYPALWQVTGMFVLVFAPAYWWAARRPAQHAHLVAVGLLGKLLGPAGFLAAAVAGQLPWEFGWVVVFNDLIWWPAFGLFVARAAKRSGGWREFLRGT